MLDFVLSVFIFSLGLLPLNNQSWHAYLAPYNPHAYENISRQAVAQSKMVKLIFDCRLDPQKCLPPQQEPKSASASAFPNLLPEIPPSPYPSFIFDPKPSPSILSNISPPPCGKLGECPLPDIVVESSSAPINRQLPAPSLEPSIPATAKPYPMPIPSVPPCGKDVCLPFEPPVIQGPPFIDSQAPEVD